MKTILTILMTALILESLINTVLTDKDCQPRQEPPPPDRECQKPCIYDADCRSRRKSCLCDGACGLSCIKHNLMCPQLETIRSGRVDIRSNYQFGSVAKYSCHEGYRLVGMQVRVCQGDERWSDRAPTCIRDDSDGNSPIALSGCPSPPNVPNAVHDGSSDTGIFELGRMVEYACLPGFEENMDAALRAWCVRDGVWKGPNMTCTSKRYLESCPRLEDIDNGWVEQEHINTVDTMATYKCRIGFFLAGRSERLCMEGGYWSGVPPSCERVACGRPPNVSNARHDGDPFQDRYPSGAQVRYTCDYGYFADGEPHVMCSGDGSWIGLLKRCSPRSCGFPGEIKNGYRKGYDFTFPNTVKYYCNEGYTLEGSDTRTCQPDGEWTGLLPRCQAVSCPPLFTPVFGRMYGAGTSYGTIIRFECDPSFQLIGSPERRCQADRTWSGQNTKCEEVHCEWPKQFHNGYIVGHNNTVNGTIIYSCNIRTDYDPKSLSSFHARCLPNGQWSSPPPICWGQCEVPSIPHAVLVRGRENVFVNHDATAEYRCHHGFTFKEGSGVMTCNNGTWTNKVECWPSPCTSYPPHVHNGMRMFVGVNHGSRAKYRCFPGFTLEGMPHTYLTCSYGKWVPQHVQPHCKEFYCPNPMEQSLPNGTIYKTVKDKRFAFKVYMKTIRHGDRIEFVCNSGFHLTGPGGATCVDGRWQPPIAAQCVPAIHPPFPKLWKPIPNVRGWD